MRFRAIAVLLLSLVNGQASAFGRPSLLDYVHTSWTHHDGIPLSSINRITQTGDGYLWITTTEEGLLRFDGVRFVPRPSPCPRPDDLLGDGANGLWVLCGDQFFHVDASGRSEASKQDPIPRTYRRRAMEFFVDRQRRLWFWGRSLTYLRPDGTQGPDIPGTVRPQDAHYCRYAQDTEGNIWFGSASGLIRIAGNRTERVISQAVYGLTASRSGGVYILQDNVLRHVGAGRITTRWDFGAEVMAAHASALGETKEGIWVGTQNHGVALVRDQGVEFFDRQQGLSASTADLLFVDHEGSVWVRTPFGLHRFRETLAYVMSSADGLPPGMPLFVYHDSRRGLWISADQGTVRIDRDSGLTKKFDLPYTSVEEDGHGRIWLSTGRDIGYLEGDRFVPVRDVSGAPVIGVSGLKADQQGRVWAASFQNGLYKVVHGRAERVHSEKFLPHIVAGPRFGVLVSRVGGTVLQIEAGREAFPQMSDAVPAGKRTFTMREDGDSLWIGGNQGLARWRGGQWTSWTHEHGLPGKGSIFEIEIDPQGRLWLMSEGGILLISRSALDQTPNGRPNRLDYLKIGSLDRVVPHRGGIVRSPRVTTGPNGEIFFATFNSIAIVNTKRISEKSFVPPIVLENVLVNRRPISMTSGSRFVEPEDIQFEYTSLSLRNPENVRFRYQLEGHDKGWIDAGTQRRAVYGSLEPGAYRFHVIGSGSEGVWNNTGASYSFVVAAPFYKTPWFLAAALLATAMLIWLVHRYRLQLESDRLRIRLETQNTERLRIAQNLHDTFLQGIQGSAWLVGSAIDLIQTKPAESRLLLERALRMVSDSTEEARLMLSSLRLAVPVAEPLIDRLNALVLRETALYPNPPQVTIEPVGATHPLLPSLTDELYFVASEALKNSLRHASAELIQITLRFQPAEFMLVIEDDGIGIEPSILARGRDGHFGFQGMAGKSRAAFWNVRD